MYLFPFRIPTLRFCPGCSLLAVKIGSGSKGANRKVGIALRFCPGCLLLVVKKCAGGKGPNRKVGIAYDLTSVGHPLAKRAQSKAPQSAFKCEVPSQTRTKTEKGQLKRLGSVVLPAAPFGVHSNLVALEIRIGPPQGPRDGRRTRT